MLLTISILILIVAVVLFVLNRKPKAPATMNHYRKVKMKSAKKQSAISLEQSAKTKANADDVLLSQAKESEGLATHAFVQPVEHQYNATLPTEPVLLYLISPEVQNYKGFALLQAILSCGMRINNHGVFEKHTQANAQGAVLFGLLSNDQPGTFNIEQMAQCDIDGMVFYIDNIQSWDNFKIRFDSMIESIVKIQQQLGGLIYTPEKVLLDGDEFSRYFEFLAQATAQANS